MENNPTTSRRRIYAPRPERIRIDWPSAFKIALIVVVLSFTLQFMLAFAGMTIAALLLV